ncbi:bifunctional adenosylcobinamide kinase/adenosylcobinamide-phosphate guanylyltransferase [Aeromicrobium sp. YIM 150415]|uniref:Adenosylcobinamide kinase n=1 Tax=Aeromicrobium piscarium TaxID=2590901 RepID=A0A554RU97_9ACTN|nr:MULTISPECIES: bifunctional adenosylcobinamide kinase/adenosylcobinamide-phosphate guanylyltransferase [Aeromicrobium]MBM9464774.1 bifunctional adenosylcobinamide kinase/adenosylcobinamide-phosphate guanylyltransferase [Aeromicrobium sp. YIM 150415]TSD57684.1 adenosylcobinamide kinase/adenosylcobinamide phosphate guanyltransferase [Aeromicrobium piscarium]
MKSLVTGGVRSGKSFYAESLVVAEPHVTYIAPGREADPDADPSHAARVAEHQARRPASWVTVESHDLADALASAEGAVVVDCIGDWVQWLIGELDGWDETREEWEPRFVRQVEEAAEAVAARRDIVVLVTQEAGMGVETDDWRARLFRDLLGYANQRLALECDDVLLIVAGRVLTL